MNISQLIAKSAQILSQAGIDSAENDSRELICHQLDISKSDLAMLEIKAAEVTEKDQNQIDQLVLRRSSRTPLQHLTGKSYFRNLELEVGPGVFIPRPETETLVEIALSLKLPEQSSFEVGAGSGAISISLSQEGGFHATAIEVSTESCEWAAKNISRYGEAVELIEADYGSYAPTRLYGLLISNPPYIPSGAIPKDPEVHLHDPEQALYSGTDGLDLIRQLALSKHFLHPGGALVFEHDESQRDQIVQLLLKEGWREITSFQDLNGRDRFIQAVA